MKQLLLFLFLLLGYAAQLQAQLPDSIKPATKIVSAKDSAKAQYLKHFSPRKATLRSAIIPGWGQIYNKKYWKVPLVWGALGTTAGIYLYNVKNYRLLRDAYNYLADSDPNNDVLVDPKFKYLSTEAIRSYRNSYRQDVDYSVLFFVLFWGLNVVDATVDAHLKLFDVDDNLSLQLKPGYSQLAHTNGISLILNLDKKHSGR